MIKQKKLIQKISDFLRLAISIKGKSPSEVVKQLSELLIDLIKQRAVKAALLKVLGSAAVGGFRARIITWFIKDIIFDKKLRPLMRKVFSSIGYVFDEIDGHIKIGKLEEAEANNDQVTYDNTVDDITG